jgi:hypothetical protein
MAEAMRGVTKVSALIYIKVRVLTTFALGNDDNEQADKLAGHAKDHDGV